MLPFEKARELFTYENYHQLVNGLFESGKVTGVEQNQLKMEATSINLQRMKRLNKTVKIESHLAELIEAVEGKWVWYLITEGWCGDAAQNLPIIAKMTELNPNIDLKVLLRDDNPEIMNSYLTNGGKAVPKLICVDGENHKELGIWGPRPEKIAQMVRDFKKNQPDVAHDEFVKNLHTWYAKDKGLSLQDEFRSLISQWKNN